MVVRSITRVDGGDLVDMLVIRRCCCGEGLSEFAAQPDQTPLALVRAAVRLMPGSRRKSTLERVPMGREWRPKATY